MDNTTQDFNFVIELDNKYLEAVSGGATDYFLKLDGVAGESRD